MAGQFVVDVSSSNFIDEVEKSAVPVIVDFWAPWCGPCRMIAPILDEIAAERAGAVKVAKVNVDESPELSARYGVRAIPTLLLVKGGEVSAQIVGMVSKKDLLGKIDALV